jgi:hypothetical protein
MKSVRYRDHPDSVYCGRGHNGQVPTRFYQYGWLGNPCVTFKNCPVCGEVHKTGADTLPCYKQYLWKRLQNEKWAEAFYKTCYGKDLGCFCAPNPCHTEVMIIALNWLYERKQNVEEHRTTHPNIQ